MDLGRRLKVAWRDAFTGDVPADLISRVECKDDIEVSGISLLTGARDKTWEILSELELRLQQEKFMLQFLDEEIIADRKEKAEKTVEKSGVELEIDNMYAKVNKPLKCKQHDSGEIDEKHSNVSDQKSLPNSQIDASYEEIAYRAPDNSKSNTVDSKEYEEVSVQSVTEPIKIRRESLGKKEPKKKVKGSVKDKIKRFEKTSSRDGDEYFVDKLDSDLARTVPTKPSTSPKPTLPVISPRPSPAARKRQQQINAYEEIELPCFSKASENMTIENSETPSNKDMIISTTVTTCSGSKHGTSQKDESSVAGCEVLDQSNCEPSVDAATNKITISNKNLTNETEKVNLVENDHYASIKETVREPVFSEKEPSVSSSKSKTIEEIDHHALLKETANDVVINEKELAEARDNNINDEDDDYAVLKDTSKESEKKSHSESFKHGDIKVYSARSHFPESDKYVDDDDNYCSLAEVRNKHKTLIEIKSGDSVKSDSEFETENLGKENTSSKLCIVSSTISRSTEDLCHYKDIDDDNIESINEEKESEMKKLFPKKEGCDLTASFIDGTSSVIGKKIKSLPSSDSDEEITDKTVPFSTEKHLPKEPTKSSRATRKRVPDYESWNFQALLTHPKVSAVDNENLGDETGSEDDLSPRLEKRSELRTVEEQNGSSDTDVFPRPRSVSPSGKYSPQLSPQMRKYSTTSNSTDPSRLSTLSCASVRTVHGDQDLLRLDSVDGHSPSPDTDTKSGDEDSVDDVIDEDEDKKMSFVDKKRAEQLRMRHLVVKGILESEKSYLHLIEQLVKAKSFLQMQVAQDHTHKISMEDITTIFYMMDQIYQKHKEFVDSLKERVDNWSDEQTIGESFKIMVLYFKLYEDYVKNYPKVLEVLPKYQENEETWKYFEEQMELFQESSKLEDILLKPVQRMQRNTLVLHDLIKHTPEDHPDYDVLKRALKLSEENLKGYNTQSNSVRSDNSQEARQLIKNGFVVEVSADKKMTRHLRYLFLFSDLLICTKHKAGSNSRPLHFLDRHREGSFKFCWSLPLCQLKMHIKGESKYDTKDSLDELKMKIGNLKIELREEMVKEDNVKDKPFSIIPRKQARNIEKLKKKIQEHEATLVEALPCLPLNLDMEGQRPHVLLFATDYERQEWREAIDTQLKKFQAYHEAGKSVLEQRSNRGELASYFITSTCPYDEHPGTLPAQLSIHDLEALINGTKLHTHVNGIGTVLLRKDEEILNGSLNVTIHKLQGLDYPCDTYCCLEMDSYGIFYKKAQTRTCFNMNFPSWDEDFELDLDGSQTLRILCYKRRPGDEDDVVIGKCALELSLAWLNSKFNEKTITMHNISITISIRHTPASKTMKRTQSKMMSGIFGVRIEYVTKRENKTVPTIVTTCVQEVEKRALNEVGIYRVSGVTSEVQTFKKLFDKNIVAAMNQVEDADIHALTGILKLYFRELPEPLFTDKFYKSFIQAVELQDAEAKEKCMLELLHSLPDANYYTITFMIEHLVRVAKNSHVNKMSINNLATIFGPTLLHPAVKDADADPMLQIARAAHDASVQSEVVHYFIRLAASGRNIRKSAQTTPR